MTATDRCKALAIKLDVGIYSKVNKGAYTEVTILDSKPGTKGIEIVTADVDGQIEIFEMKCSGKREFGNGGQWTVLRKVA